MTVAHDKTNGAEARESMRDTFFWKKKMKEEPKRQRSANFAKIRRQYPRAYKDWDGEEDEQLRRELESSIPLIEIAHRHKRPRSAVKSRIKHLGNR